MRQKKSICLILMIICLTLAGCNKDRKNEDVAGGYQIYYVNKEQTALVSQKYQPEEKQIDALVKEILETMEKPVDSIEYLCAKPESVQLIDYSLNDNILNLKFNSAYMQMDKSTEVLMRMAYVQTLIQISGVGSVEFYVEDDPLKDSNDQLIGAMNEKSFVQNDGSEVNEYESSELILYYASKDGNSLVQTTRKVTHSVNMSLEKVVMEQLINGPSSNLGLKSTIPSSTKMLGISVNDGVCYVNLNSDFLELKNDIDVEVSVYSIVNSLVELPNINKVQISVYGADNTFLSNNIDLNNTLERNLDIVTDDK